MDVKDSMYWSGDLAWKGAVFADLPNKVAGSQWIQVALKVRDLFKMPMSSSELPSNETTMIKWAKWSLLRNGCCLEMSVAEKGING